jgi:hypothetical protein
MRPNHTLPKLFTYTAVTGPAVGLGAVRFFGNRNAKADLHRELSRPYCSIYRESSNILISLCFYVIFCKNADHALNPIKLAK